MGRLEGLVKLSSELVCALDTFCLLRSLINEFHLQRIIEVPAGTDAETLATRNGTPMIGNRSNFTRIAIAR